MNVVEIVFSPTRGTQKVARMISERWSKDVVRINLSDAGQDFSKCKLGSTEKVEFNEDSMNICRNLT